MGMIAPPGAPSWRILIDRRFILIAAVTLAVALYFWLTSRYPALDDKAAMGATTPINGIAFDTLIERLPGNGVVWDITINSINWMYTNWKGMTFGILFGACALTILGLVERRGFNRPFADAALGAAIGAPLGVCVNCAAPIARGLHSAGVRLETTLSAMIASPTLNVIVVSMSFALLPWHMATIKLVASLGFVLIGVPLLTRLLFRAERAAGGKLDVTEIETAEGQGWLSRAMERIRPRVVSAHEVDSWPKAFRWLGVTLGRNLLFLIAVTLPLMILSGVLGAALVSVFPFTDFARYVPFPGDPVRIVAMMAVIATLSILMPVPMAFDVIATAVLVSAGWPIGYALPLLFGLGSFSVYSFLIIGRAISFRVAGGLMAALAVVAVLCGLTGMVFDRSIREAGRSNVALYLRNATMPAAPAERVSYGAGLPGQAWDGNAVADTPLPATIDNMGPGTVDLRVSAPMVARPGGAAAFTRELGTDIGLDVPPFLSGLEVFQPYSFFWAMSAGDVQGDGWTDLVFARDAGHGGLSLFRNRDGRFVREAIDLGPLSGVFVGTAALVDLNNDGLPELFVSTVTQGTYALWNRDGKLGWHDRIMLQPPGALLIGAPAFADLDNDGRIDILAATWSAGTMVRSPYMKAATDRILWNAGTGFRAQELSGVPGESLTSLITDVDGDGRPDIMIGDDISSGDKIYLNRGPRRFDLVKRSAGLVPYLANTTMSFDAGDIDNDLRDEIYVGQISGVVRQDRRTNSIEKSYCNDPLIPRDRFRQCYLHLRSYGDMGDYSNASYPRCDQKVGALTRGFCGARSLMMRAGGVEPARRFAMCAPIRHFSAELYTACTRGAGPIDETAEARVKDYPGAIYFANILFKRGAGGGAASGFTDVAKQFGVAQPGWTWNTRFVDLDQDGWQDMYVATGFLAHRGGQTKRYYRNIGGTGFVAAERDYGLVDNLPSTSYALLDYDRDGDVDIIRQSAVTAPIVSRNDRPAGPSLWIRLEDEIGNRAGIGARITIRTGSSDRQVREIRQSGGFASFDAPQAHFGLGRARRVEEMVVTWRDGGITRITAPVPGNSEIVIRRRATR